ncbi:MAG: ABC transporter ATP-binding protein, partial [Myxococcaceae bacterium]
MLSLRNLVKVYPGPVTALRGVDLDVPQGMFGLLGPNGAGKSTLMKILAGLLEPTSGEVTLDGLDLVRHPEALRPHLGYLPQEFGFYPYLSGQDMLRYLLELKGVTAPQGLGDAQPLPHAARVLLHLALRREREVHALQQLRTQRLQALGRG